MEALVGKERPYLEMRGGRGSGEAQRGRGGIFHSSALKAKKEMEDGRKASLQKDSFVFFSKSLLFQIPFIHLK